MTAPAMPVELPDLRRELLAKWATERSWRIMEASSVRKQMLVVEHDRVEAGVRLQVTMLEEADLYWVGEEMCDLLFGTLHTVPGDVLATDLPFPSRAGFLVFAKPWHGLDTFDAENTSVRVDGIAWIRSVTQTKNYGARETLNVAFYRCINWDDGVLGAELDMAMSLNATVDARRATTIDSSGALAAILTGRSWVPLGRSTWPTNEDIEHPVREIGKKTVEVHMHFDREPKFTAAEVVVGWEPDPDQPDAKPPEGWEPGTVHPYPQAGMLEIEEDNPPQVTNISEDDLAAIQEEMQEARSGAEDRRLMAALFTLLNTSSLSRIAEERPPRAVARREQRAGHKGAPSTVKVVYLRRPSNPDEGGSAEHAGNYSHRWVVNSHWRNQPYGPGNSKRKLILIGPYVKGPEDKPLVVRETVKAWVR